MYFTTGVKLSINISVHLYSALIKYHSYLCVYILLYPLDFKMDCSMLRLVESKCSFRSDKL